MVYYSKNLASNPNIRLQKLRKIVPKIIESTKMKIYNKKIIIKSGFETE